MDFHFKLYLRHLRHSRRSQSSGGCRRTGRRTCRSWPQAPRPPRRHRRRWGCPGGRRWCRGRSRCWRTPRARTSSQTGCCSSCCCCSGHRCCCCCCRRTQTHSHCLPWGWIPGTLESCCSSCWGCCSCPSWSSRCCWSSTCHRSLPVAGSCVSTGCDSSAAAASGWRAAWCSWRTQSATCGWVSCCWSWAWCSRTWFEQMWRPCRPRAGAEAGSCGAGRGRARGQGRGSWERGRGSPGRARARAGAGTAAPTAATRSPRTRRWSPAMGRGRAPRGRRTLPRARRCWLVKDWGHWGRRRGCPAPGTQTGCRGCSRPPGSRCCSPSRCRGSWRRPSRPSCSSPPRGRSRRRGQRGGSRWCRWWGCRSPWRRGWARGRRGRWSWGTCRRTPWRACLGTSGPGTCPAALPPAPRRTGWPSWPDKVKLVSKLQIFSSEPNWNRAGLPITNSFQLQGYLLVSSNLDINIHRYSQYSEYWNCLGCVSTKPSPMGSAVSKDPLKLSINEDPLEDASWCKVLVGPSKVPSPNSKYCVYWCSSMSQLENTSIYFWNNERGTLPKWQASWLEARPELEPGLWWLSVCAQQLRKA